ncbi:prophage MuSo2, baseplate assembly protein V [Pseudomonas protegens CHA0]|uniref:Prophage MuSo2, baseplate assembly protein V n=2 Tax=Pseudomonas TaxID=286 RepID=A0A2C9EHI6_PSEPH|nr:prophage MuSo2, baseplate assembly protein V [Pseudomonas protegens CHA0]
MPTRHPQKTETCAQPQEPAGRRRHPARNRAIPVRRQAGSSPPKEPSMSLLTRLLARGTVVLAHSANKLQSLQMRLTAGEVNDDMEHFEPYGFTSNPLAGAEGIATFLGGDRSHGVVLVVADRRYRLKALAAGEVAIYTDEGDKIHFKRGRVIDIDTATLNIRASSGVIIDSPTLSMSGKIVSQGDQVAAGISQINHVHSGVQPGPGQTGVPVGG